MTKTLTRGNQRGSRAKALLSWFERLTAQYGGSTNEVGPTGSDHHFNGESEPQTPIRVSSTAREVSKPATAAEVVVGVARTAGRILTSRGFNPTEAPSHMAEHKFDKSNGAAPTAGVVEVQSVAEVPGASN